MDYLPPNLKILTQSMSRLNILFKSKTDFSTLLNKEMMRFAEFKQQYCVQNEKNQEYNFFIKNYETHIEKCIEKIVIPDFFSNQSEMLKNLSNSITLSNRLL